MIAEPERLSHIEIDGISYQIFYSDNNIAQNDLITLLDTNLVVDKPNSKIPVISANSLDFLLLHSDNSESAQLEKGIKTPNIDAALDYLAHHGVDSNVVVSLDSSIQRYGFNSSRNPIQDGFEHPFNGILEYIGKPYDGSLNEKSLEQFKGMVFGGRYEIPFVNKFYCEGKEIASDSCVKELPKLGSQLYDEHFKYTVANIEFDSFKVSDSDTIKSNSKIFKQVFRIILNYESYYKN